MANYMIGDRDKSIPITQASRASAKQVFDSLGKPLDARLYFITVEGQM